MNCLSSVSLSTSLVLSSRRTQWTCTAHLSQRSGEGVIREHLQLVDVCRRQDNLVAFGGPDLPRPVPKLEVPYMGSDRLVVFWRDDDGLTWSYPSRNSFREPHIQRLLAEPSALVSHRYSGMSLFIDRSLQARTTAAMHVINARRAATAIVGSLAMRQKPRHNVVAEIQ